MRQMTEVALRGLQVGLYNLIFRDKILWRPMEWRSRQLNTVDDVEQFMRDCNTDADAKAFMADARLVNPFVHLVVGYLTGEFHPDERPRLFDWFEVVHPFWGRSLGEQCSSSLLAFGLVMGQQLREWDEGLVSPLGRDTSGRFQNDEPGGN